MIMSGARHHSQRVTAADEGKDRGREPEKARPEAPGIFETRVAASAKNLANCVKDKRGGVPPWHRISLALTVSAGRFGPAGEDKKTGALVSAHRLLEWKVDGRAMLAMFAEIDDQLLAPSSKVVPDTMPCRFAERQYGRGWAGRGNERKRRGNPNLMSGTQSFVDSIDNRVECVLLPSLFHQEIPAMQTQIANLRNRDPRRRAMEITVEGDSINERIENNQIVGASLFFQEGGDHIQIGGAHLDSCDHDRSEER